MWGDIILQKFNLRIYIRILFIQDITLLNLFSAPWSTMLVDTVRIIFYFQK